MQQQYDRQRGSSTQRGYGWRWQKLRRMVLARSPICTDPYGVHSGPVPATDVDHIIPKSAGGDDSMDNLQALCHECHSRKTATEDGGWGKEHEISTVSRD